MPELRKDYVLDRYVIIAIERAKRPHQLEIAQDANASKCFFCPGNEDQTPPEITRTGDKEKWKIRVFANKFPAVATAGNPYLATDNDYYTYADAIGRHEVIVETPDHNKQLWDLSQAHIAEVIRMYRERQMDIEKIDGIKYVSVFKNSGENAGCSIAHSHSQIIAYNIVPPIIQQKEDASRSGCPYCGVIQREKDSDRRVFEDENVCCFAPYASRFPYEAWIFPKRHFSRFEDLSINEMNSFAAAMKKVLAKLKELGAPYNYYFHYGRNMHFHMEIVPRFPKAKWAGFELSTGTIINPVPPEAAAAHYRE